MSGCPKVHYPSRNDAERYMGVIAKKCAARGRKAPTGAYLCRECRCWHLTSKSTSQVPPWEKARPTR